MSMPLLGDLYNEYWQKIRAMRDQSDKQREVASFLAMLAHITEDVHRSARTHLSSSPFFVEWMHENRRLWDGGNDTLTVHDFIRSCENQSPIRLEPSIIAPMRIPQFHCPPAPVPLAYPPTYAPPSALLSGPYPPNSVLFPRPTGMPYPPMPCPPMPFSGLAYAPTLPFTTQRYFLPAPLSPPPLPPTMANRVAENPITMPATVVVKIEEPSDMGPPQPKRRR